MAKEDQDFTVFAGNHKVLNVTILDDDGNADDITGGSMVWRMSRTKSSATAEVEKTTGVSPSEVDITDPANGGAKIFLEPVDTVNLSGAFYHEATVTDVNGNVSTVFLGTVTVRDVGPTTVSGGTLLVVEGGSPVTDANAYITVAFADSYHDARGNSTWTSAELKAKEEAIIQGTDYLTRKYRTRWKGIRVDQEQGLDWPRAGVQTEDFFEPETGPRPALFPGLAFVLGEDVIPIEVKHATAEAALRALSGDLMPDLDRGGDIKRLKAGSAEVEYFQSASDEKEFPAIDRLLRPLLRTVPGQRRLFRA